MTVKTPGDLSFRAPQVCRVQFIGGGDRIQGTHILSD